MGNFRDKIRDISSQQVRNYINLVSTIRIQQNQQNIIGTIRSIESDGITASVEFADGTVGTGAISTSRPIGIGTVVLLVGTQII